MDRIIEGTIKLDINWFAALEVLDYMEAYYKVRNFIWSLEEILKWTDYWFLGCYKMVH